MPWTRYGAVIGGGCGRNGRGMRWAGGSSCGDRAIERSCPARPRVPRSSYFLGGRFPCRRGSRPSIVRASMRTPNATTSIGIESADRCAHRRHRSRAAGRCRDRPGGHATDTHGGVRPRAGIGRPYIARVSRRGETCSRDNDDGCLARNHAGPTWPAAPSVALCRCASQPNARRYAAHFMSQDGVVDRVSSKRPDRVLGVRRQPSTAFGYYTELPNTR